MLRDSQIPIFLWVTAALVAHLLGGGGVEGVARVKEQLRALQGFAEEVRLSVQARHRPVTEVSLWEDEPSLALTPTQDEPSETGSNEDPSLPEQAKPERPSEPKEEPSPEKRDEPKEEPPEPEKKAEEKPVVMVPVPRPPKRVAVRQTVKEKDQSNPDAEFIGDEANRVAEQTQARITSTDEDTPNPTPGTHLGGPAETPGNADQTEIASADERKGVEDKPSPSASAAERALAESRRLEATPAALEKARAREQAQAGQQARQARAEVPEAMTAKQSLTQLPKAEEAQAASLARQRKAAQAARSATDFLGLGAKGTTESGVNLNISPATGLAAVGQDQLRRDRENERERRKSRHRGSFASLSLERWRSAIENYVPSVKLGNTTALNTAAVPFATYLNTIHNRLHPVFAVRFLGSLDQLPSDHAMNGAELSTNLEIVLNPESGNVVRMGVTKTSGVTAFDVAALEAVNQSQPFGPPPKEIVSPDGRVYLHWEFYRDPYYACSTYFARPFILKSQPQSAPGNPGLPRPPFVTPPEVPEQDQHGSLTPGTVRTARAL
jgi:TonB family protein